MKKWVGVCGEREGGRTWTRINKDKDRAAATPQPGRQEKKRLQQRSTRQFRD